MIRQHVINNPEMLRTGLKITDFRLISLVSLLPGTDQSQAQLLGPDRQILGFARMHPEDSSRGAEDFGPVQVKQGWSFRPARVCVFLNDSTADVSLLSPVGRRRGRLRHRLPGQEMDQDRRTDGLCPRESCWFSPERALRENPLSLQSVPERSKPAGQWQPALFLSVCVPLLPESVSFI